MTLPPVTYKPAFKIPGQASLSLNGLVFETFEEAHENAADLFARWTMPTAFEVVRSDLPANYRYIDHTLIALEPTP